MELVSLLWMPFVACLVLVLVLGYFGLHIVMREIIFVDLALAQLAALGGLMPYLWGEEHSHAAFLYSLIFVLVGACIFSFGRFRRRNIPQEAIIGIVYAIASAVSVLILAKAPHGHERLKGMLVGSVLYVGADELMRLGILAFCVGAIHLLFFKRFIGMSTAYRDALTLKHQLWDLLFYTTFGLFVTIAVPISGVLLIFCYLVVPAVCSLMFVDGLLPSLCLTWGYGVLGSLVGLVLSGKGDFPVGASVISILGALLILSAVVYRLATPRTGLSPPESLDRVSGGRP